MSETLKTRHDDIVAFDRRGSGPAVVFVSGAGPYRATDPIMGGTAELAAAQGLTTIVYDRLGRGESKAAGRIGPGRVLINRFCSSVLLNVRFDPTATELLRRREVTRWPGAEFPPFIQSSLSRVRSPIPASRLLGIPAIDGEFVTVDSELTWPVLVAHQLSASSAFVLLWDCGQRVCVVHISTGWSPSGVRRPFFLVRKLRFDRSVPGIFARERSRGFRRDIAGL
jgi:hypothetical protein